MRVLVFEFITGGGFSGQPLPPSLAQEGRLMVQALLDDLSGLSEVRVSVMLELRFVDGINGKGADVTVVGLGQDYWPLFVTLVRQSDAVWPVAPESGGLLQALCQTVADLGKRLLVSPADAVALTGNKHQTYLRLCQHQVATVPTRLLADAGADAGEWVVKPIDGAGCDGNRIVHDLVGVKAAVQDSRQWLVQPHLSGRKGSLSGLFKQGQAWLLSYNLQAFAVVDNSYRLTGITVNYQTDDGRYQRILQAIAAAIPGLWGYVGVDLIETDAGCRVLEINPRLTTSYTGIKRALGINVAGLVMRLHRQDQPKLQFLANQPVRITL